MVVSGTGLAMDSFLCTFVLFFLVSVWEYVGIDLFKFYRHLKSAPFITVIHLHLLSYHFVIFVSPSDSFSLDMLA